MSILTVLKKLDLTVEIFDLLFLKCRFEVVRLRFFLFHQLLFSKFFQLQFFNSSISIVYSHYHLSILSSLLSILSFPPFCYFLPSLLILFLPSHRLPFPTVTSC